VVIDLVALGLLAFFTVAGIYQGLVPQLFRIGALVLVWLLVKPLGTVFSLLFWPFGIRGLTGYYLGVLVGAVVVYGALSLLGRYLSDRFINTRTSRMELHSKLGGYLGFIKGLLVVVLVLFLLGSLPDGYLDKKPTMGAAVRGSWSVTLANLVNPFPRLTFFDDLSAYQQLLRDPAAVERLKEQPAFQQLREQPAVKKALGDPEVARKLEELDYRYLLADPKVAPLLWDPEVRKLLLQLDPRKALEAPPPPPAEAAPEGEAADPEGPAGPSVLEPTREVPPAEGQTKPEPPAGEGRLPSSPGAAPGEQRQPPPTE
jgi:hypothetical protein